MLSILPPFVSQCPSQFYRNTPHICSAVASGKTLVVAAAGKLPIPLLFSSISRLFLVNFACCLQILVVVSVLFFLSWFTLSFVPCHILLITSKWHADPAQQISGKKQGLNLGPGIIWWGGGLPREKMRGKRYCMSLKHMQTKLSCGISRENYWAISGVPEKFENKQFLFLFFTLKIASFAQACRY